MDENQNQIDEDKLFEELANVADSTPIKTVENASQESVKNEDTQTNEEDNSNSSTEESQNSSESNQENDESKTEQNNESQESVKPASLDEIEKMLNKREQDRLEKEEQERKKKELELAEIEKKKQEEQEASKNTDFDADALLTKEDKELIEDVSKEFPEIQRFIDIKMQQVEKYIEHVVGRLIDNVEKSFQDYDGIVSQRYDGVNKYYQEQNQKTALGELLQAHPDFNQIDEDLKKWIIGQEDGPYKQGLVNAYNDGTVKDLIKLVSLYKKDSGIVSGQSQNNVSDEAKKQLEEIEKEKKQLQKDKEEFEKQKKLNGLASVSSKNVNSNKTDENLSDDDIWKLYAGKADKR